MKKLFDLPFQWKDAFTKYPHGYSIFEALASWATKANALALEVEGKTDLTGDHKGTWQGLKPTQANEALSSMVESLVGLKHRALSSFPGVDPEGDSNRQAIQTALNESAGKYVIVVDHLYTVEGTLWIPSNTHLRGLGYHTGFKMRDNVPREYTLIQTGDRNQKRTHITMENFTIDFNRQRWGHTGGTQGGDLNENALAIVYTEYSLFRRLNVKDAYRQCIDISAPSHMWIVNDPEAYDPEPSRYIILDDCDVSGAGDDNITTHMSSYIWINNCRSVNPSAEKITNNSNTYEIDDGTRNVWITDCYAYGGLKGLAIQGHNNSPAPYNVNVDGFIAINNCVGIHAVHQGHLTDTDPQSKTAFNLNFNNVQIIAPRKVFPQYNRDTFHAVLIQSYTGVNFNNLVISDGREDIGNKEVLPTSLGTNDHIIYIIQRADMVSFNNVFIHGFEDVNNCIFITPSANGRVTINGLKTRDVNARGAVVWVSSAVTNVKIDNYMILHRTGYTGRGIWLDGDANTTNKSVGSGFISGYNFSPNANRFTRHWALT